MKSPSEPTIKDDPLGYRLEHDPRFLERVARARVSLRAGHGIAWADVEAGAE